VEERNLREEGDGTTQGKWVGRAWSPYQKNPATIGLHGSAVDEERESRIEKMEGEGVI